MNGDNYAAPQFLFHADALGLAAHIQQPKNYFLDSVASSVLAITGGRAEARAEAGGAGIISYQSAATQVYGGSEAPADAVRFTQAHYSDDGPFIRTAVQSIVTGFKLEVPQHQSWWHLFGSSRTVFAEELEAMLESTSDCRGENEFRTLQAFFRGVVVDGRELMVETNTKLFTDNYTKEKLDCALRDDAYRQSCSNQIIGKSADTIFATAVRQLRWADGAPPHTAIEGHRLTIDGLGSFYFGEIIIEEGFRRLTLIRFQLGSPDGSESPAAGEGARLKMDDTGSPGSQSSTTGSGTVVQAASNGQTSPPQYTNP